MKARGEDITAGGVRRTPPVLHRFTVDVREALTANICKSAAGNVETLAWWRFYEGKREHQRIH